MNDNKDRFNFVAITLMTKKKLANYSKENLILLIVNSLNSLKNFEGYPVYILRRKWNYQRNYWKRTSDRKMKKVSKLCLTERSLLQF
jgi:hypothetical protein